MGYFLGFHRPWTRLNDYIHGIRLPAKGSLGYTEQNKICLWIDKRKLWADLVNQGLVPMDCNVAFISMECKARDMNRG